MPGGEVSYLNFGYESTFKTAVTANKTFGENVVIRSLDLRNNVQRRFNLGNRNVNTLYGSRFEGGLTIEFDLSDPWFLKGVLGNLSTSGTNPYTHTFLEANLPPSMTIENGINYELSGIVRKYLGCIVADCKISAAVGDEPAKCTLTVLYADETLQISGLGSQTAATDGIYPFSYAGFQYPTGNTIANMESAEITITNTAALKWGLGNRKASRYSMRERTYDATVLNYFDDSNSYLQYTYSASGAVTPNATLISGQAGCTLVFDNGQVSAQQRKYTFTFTKSIIDHHGLPQSIEEDLMETADIMGGSLIIQVINSTSTMP